MPLRWIKAIRWNRVVPFSSEPLLACRSSWRELGELTNTVKRLLPAVEAYRRANNDNVGSFGRSGETASQFITLPSLISLGSQGELRLALIRDRTVRQDRAVLAARFDDHG